MPPRTKSSGIGLPPSSHEISSARCAAGQLELRVPELVVNVYDVRLLR